MKKKDLRLLRLRLRFASPVVMPVFPWISPVLPENPRHSRGSSSILRAPPTPLRCFTSRGRKVCVTAHCIRQLASPPSVPACGLSSASVCAVRHLGNIGTVAQGQFAFPVTSYLKILHVCSFCFDTNIPFFRQTVKHYEQRIASNRVKSDHSAPYRTLSRHCPFRTSYLCNVGTMKAKDL